MSQDRDIIPISDNLNSTLKKLQVGAKIILKIFHQPQLALVKDINVHHNRVKLQLLDSTLILSISSLRQRLIH